MQRCLSLTLLATLILGSSLALADGRDHNRNERGYERHAGNHRIDSRRAPYFSSSRNRYHNRNNDNWSVNLNLNSGWSSYSNLNYRSGFQSWGNPWASYTTIPGLGIVSTRPAPVIIEHNTYITSNPVITGSAYQGSNRRSATSLLKDRYGRCFERRFDALGNETRIEVPATACNY